MAADDAGRQPFSGSASAECTDGSSGLALIGPVPAGKRLVVESVSAVATTSIPGTLFTLQLNGPFTLFMTPALVSDGPFGLRRYHAVHAVRFYVEPGQSIQLQVSTTGAGGSALCNVSGYLLDV